MKSTRLEIRHFRYCLAVLDAGGFRAAAERLNIAQPAITRAVRQIEDELGFQIFDRTGLKIRTTEAGDTFLMEIRHVVTQFERILRASRRNDLGNRGHIIVGYSHLATSTRLTGGLRAFQRSRPGVQVEMDIVATDPLLRRLEQGVTDIAFVLDCDHQAPHSIRRQRVWTAPLGLVVPHDFNRAHVAITDLDGMPLVLGVRENWRPYRDLIDTIFDRTGMKCNTVDQAWDIQVIFQRIAEGTGFTIYPMTAEHVLPSALRMVPVRGLDTALNIAMAWNAQADTELIAAFRNFFAEIPTA